jgi:hypothetical protein
MLAFPFAAAASRLCLLLWHHQSEFAILVCRAAAAHHAAAGGPSAMAACEAGVAPRGKGVQGAFTTPATPAAGAAREQ